MNYELRIGNYELGITNYGSAISQLQIIAFYLPWS